MPDPTQKTTTFKNAKKTSQTLQNLIRKFKEKTMEEKQRNGWELTIAVLFRG